MALRLPGHVCRYVPASVATGARPRVPHRTPGRSFAGRGYRLCLHADTLTSQVMKTPTLIELWQSTFDLYRADDVESGVIRAHHIGAVVRLVPALLVANAVNGAIVLLVFGPRGGAAPLLWLTALLPLGWLFLWIGVFNFVFGDGAERRGA